VLGHFAPDEKKKMEESVRLAAQAAAAVVKEGPDAAMNQYNQKRREGKEPAEG